MAGLSKDPEMPQEPPQDDEDDDRGQASAAQFFRAPTGSDSPQKFTHFSSIFDSSILEE
jgi:hypothetical protein